MSELAKLQKRIDHLMMNTGVRPTVLDIPPLRWDALKFELSTDSRFGRYPLVDENWDTVKQLQVFGVRVTPGRID